ncbi:MAG: hypothetical protein ACI9DK_001572, partial [Vicingaceae bacterium]
MTSGVRGSKTLKTDSTGLSIFHRNYDFVNNPSFDGGIIYYNNYLGYGAQYN